MKRFFLMFYLLCKRQLKHVALTILLFAMPVIGMIYNLLPSMHENGVISIALYASDDNKTALDAIELLVSKESEINFYRCDSEEELENAVISREAQGGYIFDDNLKENLLNSDLKDNITLVQNGSSIVTQTTNEIVFSAVLSSITKDISIKYMKDNSFFTPDKWDMAVTHFSRTFETLYNNGSSLKLFFKTLNVADDGTYSTTSFGTKVLEFPIRNIMVVIIFIACLLGAANWISDKESGVFAPMPKTLVTACRPLYILVPALMFGLSGIVTIAASGNFTSFSAEFGVMAVYVIINVAFGTLMTFIFKKSRTITALLPVFILCSLLFCPVFLDLSIYIPAVNVLNKFLPPYYYMHLL